MNRVAVPCMSEQAVLGEGARWDARRAELLRVDIVVGQVFRDRVSADGSLASVRTYQLDRTVGAIAPIAGDDGWLLAAGRGFVHLSEDGQVRPLGEAAPVGTRMNDGACDPQGRFWAGTLAEDFRTGGGALYRLDGTGRIDLMLEGLTISNGLGWSPDGRTMYLVDSGPRVVHAFDFDGRTGTISRQRLLIAPPQEAGAPDGLTVDSGGDLWIAFFGGGQVRRYAPDATLLDVIAVPAAQATSCAFGGSELDGLFVTTATEGWSSEERLGDPAAGIVYRVGVDAIGRPAALFRPDVEWWSAMRDARRAADASDGEGTP